MNINNDFFYYFKRSFRYELAILFFLVIIFLFTTNVSDLTKSLMNNLNYLDTSSSFITLFLTGGIGAILLITKEYVRLGKKNKGILNEIGVDLFDILVSFLRLVTVTFISFVLVNIKINGITNSPKEAVVIFSFAIFSYLECVVLNAFKKHNTRKKF